MLEVKNLGTPDDHRVFPNGQLDVVTVGAMTFGFATFEPGWRWTQSLRSIVGTDTCQAAHNGYCASGSMHILMDDGTESDIGPGDAFVISPGHDAWVTGNEPCIAYDFSGYANYAKPQE